MAEPIRFDDGAAYERMMGVWSRIAGGVFLDWLAQKPGLSWADIGCGNGAFTELIIERCAPRAVDGIDPSEGQLAFARTRPGAHLAQFKQGDAMALPFGDRAFDVATMALVLFFVPDPARGVAEMVRVVKPGGTVAAYAWDMLGGGFPMRIVLEELGAMGYPAPNPPSSDASKRDVMQQLWTAAGLREVETRVISVERTYEDFNDFWGSIPGSASIKAALAGMTAARSEELQERVRQRLPSSADGRIVLSATANAVKGRVAV